MSSSSGSEGPGFKPCVSTHYTGSLWECVPASVSLRAGAEGSVLADRTKILQGLYILNVTDTEVNSEMELPDKVSQ